MQRVDRQNIYITKLNEKLDREGQYAAKTKGRKTQRTDRRSVSTSLDDLPSLNSKKIKPSSI